MIFVTSEVQRLFVKKNFNETLLFSFFSSPKSSSEKKRLNEIDKRLEEARLSFNP